MLLMCLLSDGPSEPPKVLGAGLALAEDAEHFGDYQIGATIQNARSFKAVMGMRVSEWAQQKQLCPQLVYSIVAGQRKCLRGLSLQIARELGMK